MGTNGHKWRRRSKSPLNLRPPDRFYGKLPDFPRLWPLGTSPDLCPNPLIWAQIGPHFGSAGRSPDAPIPLCGSQKSRCGTIATAEIAPRRSGVRVPLAPSNARRSNHRPPGSTVAPPVHSSSIATRDERVRSFPGPPAHVPASRPGPAGRVSPARPGLHSHNDSLRSPTPRRRPGRSRPGRLDPRTPPRLRRCRAGLPCRPRLRHRSYRRWAGRRGTGPYWR